MIPRQKCENNNEQCSFCSKIRNTLRRRIGGNLCEFGQHLQDEHERTFFRVHHANMRMRGDTRPGVCGWCQKTHTAEEIDRLNKEEKKLVKPCECLDCLEYKKAIERDGCVL